MKAPEVPVSIIIPALDEAACIAACLERLAPLRARGCEVLVVDGGSSDASAALAATRADRVLVAPRGRASQMNAGAAAARGAILLFLHADTALPPEADRLVQRSLAGGGPLWGRFDVRIDGRAALLPVVAFCMNLRSRITGIATGDQAIFVRREAFAQAGGYPPIALMEDIALSRALRRLSRPACLRERAVTSGRRWESRGTVSTVLLMWRLRIAYALGADPGVLARRYGAGRPHA